MNGWIKLHRKIINNLIFDNEKGFKIWIWCLLKTNHQSNNFLLGRQKMTTKGGQFIFGSKTASEELKMAISTIWYWLEFLEKEKQVEIKRTNKYSIITIKNWDNYQEVGNKSESNQQTDGKQIGTNKKVKNEKEDNAVINPAFQEIINYFIKSVEKSFAYKPKIDRADGARLKWALGIYTRQDIEDMIDFYLKNKAENNGITLKAIFSTHSLNLFEQKGRYNKFL